MQLSLHVCTIDRDLPLETILKACEEAMLEQMAPFQLIGLQTINERFLSGIGMDDKWRVLVGNDERYMVNAEVSGMPDNLQRIAIAELLREVIVKEMNQE